MAGAWGKALDKIQVGFFYDSLRISADGKRAQISGGRVRIRRGVTISDQTNSWTWAGDAVIDGGTSNVNLGGKGDKTIALVEGQWVTLSSTKRTTKTLKVTATGVNYAAGGTLTVSVTVTYPQLDPFSPPPPETPDTDAFTNPWADEDAPDLHLEPYLQHTYRVLMTDTGSAVELPAWGVEVTLDGGRAPWGTARFKLPLDYARNPTWFSQVSPFGNRAPYGASRIQIVEGGT